MKTLIEELKAIQAFEDGKQCYVTIGHETPKKPHKNRSKYYCPNCKTCVGENHINYKIRKNSCFNCGQRINWEEEK